MKQCTPLLSQSIVYLFGLKQVSNDILETKMVPNFSFIQHMSNSIVFSHLQNIHLFVFRVRNTIWIAIIFWIETIFGIITLNFQIITVRSKNFVGASFSSIALLWLFFNFKQKHKILEHFHPQLQTAMILWLSMKFGIFQLTQKIPQITTQKIPKTPRIIQIIPILVISHRKVKIKPI